MKAKLSVADTVLNGYINIDPTPKVDVSVCNEDTKVLISDFMNLNDILYDYECQEIILNHTLSYLRSDIIYDFLQCVVRKLRNNGKLIIVNYDCYSVLRGFINGEITTPQLNTILYGNGLHAWDFKKAMISIDEICSILMDLNLKITIKNINADYLCKVVGTKNE